MFTTVWDVCCSGGGLSASALYKPVRASLGEGSVRVVVSAHTSLLGLLRDPSPSLPLPLPLCPPLSLPKARSICWFGGRRTGKDGVLIERSCALVGHAVFFPFTTASALVCSDQRCNVPIGSGVYQADATRKTFFFWGGGGKDCVPVLASYRCHATVSYWRK